jgi:hypothetical protein
VKGQVDPRRLTASPLVLALVILACGCSASSSATPTADHHGTTTTGAPRTTTTTSAPSATPTTVPVLVPQAPGWSLGLTTLPPGGGFTSLSCISDTFCVAAGGGTTGGGAGLVSGSGVTLSWDGAAWSSPSVYYPAPATGPVAAPALPTITCTSGPLCVIVDGSDHVSTGDGTDWSSPVPIAAPELLPANPADPGVGHPGSRTSAVSCPTPALCAVVDNTGRTFTLRDNSWLAPQSFGTAQGFGATAPKTALYQSGRVGVSCPTLTSCTAVVGSSVLRWDGATWSAEATPWTTSLAPGAGIPVSIACPTVDLCAVVNGDDIVVRHAGGAWTPRQVLDPGRQLDAISCPTRSFCIAADDTGSVMLWNGTTWTGPQPVIPAATQYTGIGVSVSCPNDRFCMIMNADGDYATYTGPGTAPAGP